MAEMTDMAQAKLLSALGQLYSVFGRYQIPTEATYCHHCVSDSEDKVLRSKPLAELTADELARYSWKAISTWGTVEQFKYLLPRLFETVATTKNRYDPEVLFKKPQLAGFREWSSDEQAALTDYCDALWRFALAHHPIGDALPSFPSIDDCLCSIGQIIDDLTPYLSVWDSDRSTTATLHLVDFADENASTLRESRQLSNAFWDERRTQMRQVADWFMTQDFSLVFEIADATVGPVDFRDELKRSIAKR